MRLGRLCSSLILAVVCCLGCAHKTSSPPQQAQAPMLQTGKGTLPPPKTPAPQQKSESPLASPLPPPSAQNVPLPPPPTKKVHHKVKTPKPTETNQASTGQSSQSSSTPSPASTPPAPAQQVASGAGTGTGSPIGQLTTGDSATEEKTKHDTVDLIGETQQSLNGIKRNLSPEEKLTATQIRTFLKQAQQALDNGDTEGAHGLALKAKQLLDELTKP